DFDAVQRCVDSECSRDPIEELTLRGALRQPTAERLARSSENAVYQSLLVAALRHRERDPAAAAERQCLFDQVLLDQPMTEQHQRGFRAIVVKLTNERGQHLLDRELAVVAGEI